MDADYYQRRTRDTAIYPGVGEGTLSAISYTALGLVSEAGEVAGKIKKVIRDQGGEVSRETRLALVAELGDVAWYLARLTDEINVDLDEILVANLTKLSSRKDRGVIGGSGDKR